MLPTANQGAKSRVGQTLSSGYETIIRSEMASEPTSLFADSHRALSEETKGKEDSITSCAQSGYSSALPAHIDENAVYHRKKLEKPFKSRRIDPAHFKDRPVAFYNTKAGLWSVRRSNAIFAFLVLVALGVCAFLIYQAYKSVPQHKYCLVFEDNFDGDTLNTTLWHQDVGLPSAFGSVSFDMSTNSANNSYVKNSRLHIVPTLTADWLGEANVVDGYILNLGSDCASTNQSYCITASNASLYSVLPPIMSGRLQTRRSAQIKFGRIEIKMKMPTGNWIRPSILLLPENNTYGAFPGSGQIDFLESKGNAPKTQDALESNAVRTRIHWGPAGLPEADRWPETTSYSQRKRGYFNQQDYLFGLDWDEKSLFTWYGDRSKGFFNQKFNKPFWKIGRFDTLASDLLVNGTAIQNPWANSSLPNVAPFDQAFYLVLSVAVGGTDGYFSDSAYGTAKPWVDTGSHPVWDFWQNKDQWLPTWPENVEDRGMSIDYVKMWQQCD